MVSSTASFPNPGLVQANIFGTKHNYRQQEKRRYYKVLAHKERTLVQNLKDQYKSNSNPANRMKDSWNLKMAKQLDLADESKKETSTLRRPEVM